MKKNLLLCLLLLVGMSLKASEIPANPSTFINIYNNVAQDGDVIVLDAGTYSTSISFPTGKSIILRAAGSASSTPLIAFQVTDPSGPGGSLTFDGLEINREGDYFFNSTSTPSMTSWKFINCTIKNIRRSIYNSTNKSGNVNNITFDKCTITACGTNGTNFLTVSQTVDEFIITNSTIYNYIGGDFFHPNNATATKNITVTFTNNTFYKCIWNKGYGWVSVGNLYPAGNTYLFKNNIFDSGANTDPVNNQPLLVYRGNGTITEQNNIKINYQGNNGGTTNATNLTLGSGALQGYSVIPYIDANSGNFSLPSTSPFANAGLGSVAVGDPRWIKVINEPINVITNVFPTGSGQATPTSLTVAKGDSVAFSASRNFGYRFKHWQDEGGNVVSTNASIKLKLTENTKLTAVFETLITYALTTTMNGSQWGSINLSPAPTNGRYEAGTSVSVTAISNPVANFLNWGDQSTLASRTLQMNSDQTLVANYDEIPFIVGWDFKSQSQTSARVGDFYSESTNTGLINIYESVNGATPTTKTWLPSTGGFNPSYPHLRFWSPGLEFKTTRRHLKAQVATTNYRNIQVKSMISGNYQAYSIMTLQYSLDDVNFIEFGRVDLTQTYGTSWKELNAVLPLAAENKSKVYIRWIADTSSPIINEGTDNDGTAITNIFLFADKDIPVDNDPPILISSVPAANSSTATINGSIILTFNERLKAGSGSITLGNKVLTGAFGSKTVTFAYEKLNYDTQYTLNVPAGALTDLSGNLYTGLTLTFKTGVRTEPVKRMFDAVVAKDGSGNFTSVVEAIAAAPTGRTAPWVIFIKNGIYTGHHDIPASKPFIHLIGQSRDGVVISDDRVSGTYAGKTNYHVSEGATMVVNATDCYFENMILENSHGYQLQSGPQALALYTIKDRFAMNNCYLRSFQDTYLTGARHYILNSKIEGTVDFIYGGGDVFFDRDTLTVTRSGAYIVAPNHLASAQWGYVFSNNVINESKVTGAVSYFGRPWQNAPKAVFINTKLLTGIHPAGWQAWYTAPTVFADYGTTNANGSLVDVSQRLSSYSKDGSTVTAKNFLTDNEAAGYTYENVVLVAGDPWDPRMIAESPAAPTNLSVSNNSLSWQAAAYARLYVVTRNNQVIGFSTTTSYEDQTAVPGQTYSYAIQSVSESGALSQAVSLPNTLPVTGFNLKGSNKGNSNLLSWTTTGERFTSHFEIERSKADIVDFKFVSRSAAKGEAVTISTYTYIDNDFSSGDKYYRIKAVDHDGKYIYSNVVILKGLEREVFSLYPTLVIETLNVVHPERNQAVEATVSSVNGAIVKAITLKPNTKETKIGLQGLNAGTYILSCVVGHQRYFAKFIKL